MMMEIKRDEMGGSIKEIERERKEAKNKEK